MAGVLRGLTSDGNSGIPEFWYLWFFLIGLHTEIPDFLHTRIPEFWKRNNESGWWSSICKPVASISTSRDLMKVIRQDMTLFENGGPHGRWAYLQIGV